ncbi:hypothetical protein DL93DRAFT_1376397 [Clavulina sp. PMI_390]|nr:hypothetical protein DL93DRAFT_1376397 [Clavulina sp. PMI_390]
MDTPESSYRTARSSRAHDNGVPLSVRSPPPTSSLAALDEASHDNEAGPSVNPYYHAEPFQYPGPSTASGPPVTRNNGRRRTQPNESVSFSVSSEDPDGVRVPHDARPFPDTVGSINPRARARWTQSTMGVSSHYPQSSSDVTATESSSVPSTPTEGPALPPPLQQPQPVVADNTSTPYYLDPNDVSYRLRLLVKNNYYLPPAHSKPRHVGKVLDTAPAASTKHSPASLRDLLRAMSLSPRPAPPSPLPVARRTPLGARRPPEPALSPTFLQPPVATRPLSAEASSDQESRGRVVVIRERLDDDDEPSPSLPTTLPQPPVETPVGVIDPTDVVDLPSYAFEPQASLGNVLGINPVGAEALADFLPPHLGNSRGMSPHDEAWRRALLMQAVDLSMSSIPDSDRPGRSMSTPPSIPSAAAEPPSNISVQRSSTRSTTQGSRPRVPLSQEPPHKPILAQLDIPDSISSIPAQLPPHQQPPASLAHTSLFPPPRRRKSNPAPLPTSDDGPLNDDLSAPWETIRKTLSTPLLSDGMNRDSIIPDVPPIVTSQSNDSISSGSNYSGDENMLNVHDSRVSKDVSIGPSDRYSISARSHATSAFGPGDLLPPELTSPYRASTHSTLASRRPHTPTPLALDSSHLVEEPASTSTPRSIVGNRPRSRTVSDILPPSPRSPARPPFLSAHPSTIALDHGSGSTHLHPFDSFDRTKPVTNTPSPASRYFTPSSNSRRSPRIPESTFELLTHEDYHPRLSGDDSRRANSMDQARSDGRLGDLFRNHIEAEKDHIRRIASNLRH